MNIYIFLYLLIYKRSPGTSICFSPTYSVPIECSCNATYENFCEMIDVINV